MSKTLILILSFLSIFILASCTEDSKIEKITEVKLIELRVSDSNLNLESNNLFINQVKLTQSNLRSSIDNFVFPGDVLNFTIELEDPNYEFVSLLSITFNDNIIRANVGDTIITTRDCGINICIDFPIVALKDVNVYTVSDLRFVMLNTEGAIQANIDSDSKNEIAIEVYSEDIFPYVVASVRILNNFLKDLKFYTNNEIEAIMNSNEDFQSNMYELIVKRTIKVINPDNDVFGTPNSEPYSENKWFFPSNNEFEAVFNTNSMFQRIEIFPGTDSEFMHSIFEPVTLDGSSFSEFRNGNYNIYFGLLDQRFNEITAFNVGNDIYLKFDGESRLFYSMGRLTKFEIFEFDNNQ